MGAPRLPSSPAAAAPLSISYYVMCMLCSVMVWYTMYYIILYNIILWYIIVAAAPRYYNVIQYDILIKHVIPLHHVVSYRTG